MAIKHNFVSPIPDSGDPDIVGSNEWNDAHSIENDTVTEAMLSISDNTTRNVSTSAHGFAPKGDGDTNKFLNANGAYSTPTADFSKIVTYNGDVVVHNGDVVWTT